MLRSPDDRRKNGATYTPASIVKNMVEWAASNCAPNRIIDPGVGSARFLLRAGAVFPTAQLVGIDIDPVATLMARANLSVAGLGFRSRVILMDYRLFTEQIDGTTLYIGNPPYVRHHQIMPEWKEWLRAEALNLDLTASKLAGLHVYFFLATARAAKPNDVGVFVTASEWLDVNYGALVRSLMLGKLGGKSVTVVEPTAQPFPDAATTAAITTFEIGTKPRSLCFKRVDDLSKLGELEKGRKVHRDRLFVEQRWSHLTRAGEKPPEGFVELGELCRVHRGTVTGANGVWIAGPHSADLPESVLYPTITRAREVLDAEGLLSDVAGLRRVIDLPADLDELNTEDRSLVARFLRTAQAMGANKGYVARHRKAWWSVGLRAPAPIFAIWLLLQFPRTT
ncbi:N5-glutamine S-adenosyl-L-methionine-dependent methyltransferase [Methyloligella halotolerans]|uniref:site-specific DNA-methyltransferase (adenine-specific) n=1 Tax=Methyloligella halotolerans TaxID=1177755 RepID=A0A1E2RYX6_9HYPH|nr:N-6 DNA methylase [Methyloligella halotolerans]ODA67352.1 N5-glutamine S-adenosyl-L-methionine-dependent methyltransferase [Methyloligella halotolerans]